MNEAVLKSEGKEKQRETEEEKKKEKSLNFIKTGGILISNRTCFCLPL